MPGFFWKTPLIGVCFVMEKKERNGRKKLYFFACVLTKTDYKQGNKKGN